MFVAPNFECFTKYDAFCEHSFNYACLSRLRRIVVKRFEIMEKLYSPKHCLKGWWGNAYAAYLTPPPLDPPLVVS